MAAPDTNARHAATDQTTSQQTPPPRKKRRRWGRRLGVLFLLFVVVVGALVALAPTIASSSAVSKWALSKANGEIAGSIEVAGLSLSWTGPTEIRGVQIADPQRQQVLAVRRIASPSGLWQLLTSGENFGELRVEAPQVTLYINADNEISLVKAFETGAPAEQATTSSDAMPQPRGVVLISDGVVRAVRAGGETYEVRDISVRIELETLDNIAAEISAALADGAKLALQARLRGLPADGSFDPRGLNGTVRLASDRPIDVASLGAVLAPELGLRGTASLKLDATFHGGDGEATIAASLKGFHSEQAARTSPLDVDLTGTGKLAGDRLDATVELASDAGNVRARLGYDWSQELPELDADRLVGALLGGESVTLPGFDLTASGRIDLAALERSVPGLLHVRPDQRITAGQVTISDLVVRGGAQPKAGGTIALENVTAENAGRTARLSPITVSFNADLVPQRGLDVGKADLTAGFAHISAQGTAADLSAQFDSDLARLRQELGQIFDLTELDLAGAVGGRISLRRTDKSHVAVEADLTADRLRYRQGETNLELPRTKVLAAGALLLVDDAPQRVSADKLTIDLAGELQLDTQGWYDLGSGGLHGAVRVAQAELATLARRAAALGASGLEPYAGTLALEAQADRAASGQPLVSTGRVAIRNARMDGKPLARGDVKLDWTDARIAPGFDGVRLAAARLESSLASLTASDVQWTSADQLTLRGKVKGSADLAACMELIARLAEMAAPPAVAGRLTLDADAQTGQGVIALTGRTAVDDLTFGAGRQAIREKRVDLAFDAQVDQPRERITIRNGKLTSNLLSARVGGTIDHYAGNAVLDLSGQYDAGWDDLSALLHQFAPATAETVVLQGRTTSEFFVRGPLSQPGSRPAFRGLKAETSLGWDAAELYGVPLGKAAFAPRLADGRLTLPRTTIPAAQGRMNLGATVDLRPAEPVLRVPGRLAVLEKVAVTRELADSVLSRINPIFLHLSRVEGIASLDVADVAMTLGEGMTRGGSGQGRLDLENMRLAPGGLLTELLVLGGVPEARDYAVLVSGLDFALKDGRIWYKDFTLTFSETFDLKFYGSVGLDETLDLVVSVPISAELLRRLGVRGSAVAYAERLAGSRVDLPLVGTRLKPRIDLSRVDVRKLVETAAKKEAGSRLDDLLRGLQKRSDDKKTDEKAPKKKSRRSRRSKRRKR